MNHHKTTISQVASSGALVAMLIASCGGTLPRPEAAQRTPLPTHPHEAVLRLEPIELTVTAKGDMRVTDALGLFEAGGRDLGAQHYQEALKRYDALLARFSESRLVLPALYNAGLAHEGLRQFARAASRYARIVDRFGHRHDAIDATFRLGGCYAELGDWKRSAAVFGRLARRAQLGSSERVEAYARQGLALFRQEDYDASRRALGQGIGLVKRVDAFERLDADFFAAMLYYYFAAIPHAQFRGAAMDPGSELARDMDEKARLLIVAQGRYIETIRVRNPYWATAAGFQIGSLYREFYDALMRALPDFDAAARDNARQAGIDVALAKQQLASAYLEQLHKRIRPLLEKAMRVFEKNVVVARRIGVDGAWIAKSRRQIRELEELITATPAGVIRRQPAQTVLPEDVPGDPDRHVPGLRSNQEVPDPVSPRIRPGAASRAVM
jgi:tetratricopeptide (TPR) repeat protein